MGRVGGCGLAGMETYISTNRVGARETDIVGDMPKRQ
jgi:hypothetical protein